MKCAFLRDLFQLKLSQRSTSGKKNEPLEQKYHVIEKRFRDAIKNSIFLCFSSALFFSIGALTVMYQGMSPILSIFAALLSFTFGALGLVFGILNIKNARDQKRVLDQCERKGCREDKGI